MVIVTRIVTRRYKAIQAQEHAKRGIENVRIQRVNTPQIRSLPVGKSIPPKAGLIRRPRVVPEADCTPVGWVIRTCPMRARDV